MKEERMSVTRQHLTWKLQSITDTEVFIFLISVTIILGKMSIQRFLLQFVQLTIILKNFKLLFYIIILCINLFNYCKTLTTANLKS